MVLRLVSDLGESRPEAFNVAELAPFFCCSRAAPLRQQHVSSAMASPDDKEKMQKLNQPKCRLLISNQLGRRHVGAGELLQGENLPR